jgi:hypothetical protein
VATTARRLPVDIADGDRRALDALTARAIRLALTPRTPSEAAPEVAAVANGSPRLLDAAIARLDRALAEEPSTTVTRAIAHLAMARALTDGRRGVLR